ncbi:MAG: hypothetical protein H6648_09015 [Caldilineae bacterium]|nr:hypothetical protein [Chloroflexota bacterium]MCB9177287.1 hypothetical protein [Caldilineae bacterium]
MLAESEVTLASPGWRLRARQLTAIVRIELRQRLTGLRILPALLLALAPVGLLMLAGILIRINLAPGDTPSVAEAVKVFAEVYHTLVLRFCVFFGCAAIFLMLFRGDVMSRSLHYWFMSPVRREVLVLAKFLAGLATAGLLFTGTTVLGWLAIYIPAGFDQLGPHMLHGPGLRLLATYVGITWLACLGYGAVFLAVGQLFRNPILPTAFVLAWEGIHPFLPPLLKKLSVTHYLGSLGPVPVEVPLISLVAEPAPVPVAVGGLLLFSLAVLGLAAWRIRRMEIDYGSD